MSASSRRRLSVALVTIAVAAAVSTVWWISRPKTGQAAERKGQAGIPVVTTTVQRRDVPVRLRANGSVVALQSVDLRAQITSTVREVHIREGQSVRTGDLLFSFDSRAEEAAIRKAAAQVEKDRTDLATASRNLDRQRELFNQKFISQAALDAAENQVDTLNGQLAVDQAALEAARVARAYTEIRASFAGRTGTIGVRAGSLVQPNSVPLVTVTQIDPIAVSFSVPEKELAGLQRALVSGPVSVDVTVDGIPEPISGNITFIDNAVDSASGTIRVKAEFANANTRLWPGMYVTVSLAPRMIEGASVLPAQSVQTGPDSRFVYVVDQDGKVSSRPVTLAYVEEGFAVVNGVPAGTRVVVEGAQNLRPGSLVTESVRAKKEAAGGEEKKAGAQQSDGKNDGGKKSDGKPTLEGKTS